VSCSTALVNATDTTIIELTPQLPTIPYVRPEKPEHGIDEMKQRLLDTLDRIPQGIIDEASGKHGCMHV